MKGNTKDKSHYVEQKQKSKVPKGEMMLKDRTVSNIEVEACRRPFRRPLDLRDQW